MPQYEYVPAKGTRAYLLRSPEPPYFFFRVYKHPTDYRAAETRKRGRGEPNDPTAGDYEDFDIDHYDCEVVIEDDRAGFYHFPDGRKTFDYFPKIMDMKLNRIERNRKASSGN